MHPYLEPHIKRDNTQNEIANELTRENTDNCQQQQAVVTISPWLFFLTLNLKITLAVDKLSKEVLWLQGLRWLENIFTVASVALFVL